MPAKFLESRIAGTELKLRIHTDTSRLDDDGNPSADAVRDFTWGLPPKGGGETKAAYRTRVKGLTDEYIAEAKRQVAQEKTRREPPPPADVSVLNEEGQEF